MSVEKYTILAIGAHADDLELICSGTLGLWAKEGHRVVMATTTWCKYGCYNQSLDDCSKTRHKEAAQAAGLIGAEYRALMFPDNTVNPYDGGQQHQIVELIRQMRPDVIVTHAPSDYHTDHTNLAELVKWTGPVLGIPQYETKSDSLDYNPALYYMDTVNGRYFEPTDYVNISNTIDIKREMVSAYQSQISYIKQYFGIDLLEQVEIIARFRGHQAGVRYAEAFRRNGSMGWGDLTHRYLP